MNELPCEKCLLFPICRTKYRGRFDNWKILRLIYLSNACQYLENYIYFIIGTTKDELEAEDIDIYEMGYNFSLFKRIRDNIELFKPIMDILEGRREKDTL